MMGNGAIIHWRDVLAFMVVSFVWGAGWGLFGKGLISPRRSRQQVAAAELAVKAAEAAAASAKITAAEAENRAAEAKSAAATASRVVAEGAPPDEVESTATEAALAAQSADAAARVADGAARVAALASNAAATWQRSPYHRIVLRGPTCIAGLVMIAFSVLAFSGMVFGLSQNLRGIALLLDLVFFIGTFGALLVFNTLLISLARLPALDARANCEPNAAAFKDKR